MNRWKDELEKALDIPQPMRKSEFLRQLNLCKMSVNEFLYTQIGYIRKRVWCVSALIFIISILGLAFLPGTVLWLISGLTPLLALSLISECGRSERYKMIELEMATRFSLRSVTCARLAILGLMNLLLLGILFLIGLWDDSVTTVAVALYIITPFLLTTFIGLYIMRKFRGKEVMYSCTGISVGISIFLLVFHNIIPFIYMEQSLTVWLIMALVSFFGNGRQCILMIKQTEELTWNLT